MIGRDEIEHRFGTHQAVGEYGSKMVAPRHVEIRRKFKELARYLDEILPDGREKSVAFTDLENAAMWAHKALARDTAGSRLVEDEPEKEIDSSEDRADFSASPYRGGGL